MLLFNVKSEMSVRSIMNVSLAALLSIGLLSGCSEESKQKASDAIEEAKEMAQDSMEKAQETLEDSVEEATEKMEEVTESVTDSVTDTVEETYEKAKSLSAVEAAPILLAENAATGGELYKSCVGCHGAKGEGGVGPRLAGRDTEQMLANLKTYREGGQVGPMSSLMTPYVKSLSDTDLKVMVDYIGQF